MAVSVFGEMTLTNNTISENRSLNGGGGGLYLTGDTGSHSVYNNIIWGNTATGGSICGTSCNDVLIVDAISNSATVGTTVLFLHNDFSDFFATCDPLLGCEPHRDISPTANFSVDPLFADPSLLNFNLTEASPLIDQGLASAPGLGDTDLDGGFRALGAGPDLGALESPFTAGGGTPTPPPSTENCANNVDDDGDTLIDCIDPDCAGAVACQDSTPPSGDEPENCGNNIDDDGNGLTDCADPVCTGAVACLESDGSDGDGGSDGGGNTVTASGCALAKGTVSSSPVAYFLLPLAMALAGWIRFGRRRQNS